MNHRAPPICLGLTFIPPPFLDEYPRERSIPGHRIVAGCDEDLDADVVGASVEVRGKSRFDAFGRAVEHQCIDEAVAATIRDVLGCEAVAEQVVDVVA